MSRVAFRTAIQLNPPNPYVLVDAERAAELKPGWRKSMPVLVRVNGQPNPPWRINMMPTGNGDFYLYLHNEVRTAAGVGVSNEVDVELELDEAYRGGPTHPIPE